MLAILDENGVSYANWNYKSYEFGFIGNDGKSIDEIRDAVAPAKR